MTDTRTTDQRRADADADAPQTAAPRAAERQEQLTTEDIAERHGPRVEGTINSSDGQRTAVSEPDRHAEEPLPTHEAPQRPAEDRSANESASQLFDDSTASELRDRWTNIQTGFVDEPRTAVEGADALVADVMKQLAESFASERKQLEAQWSRGDDVSTEDLRVALRRYRSFFDRLLSI